MTFGRTWEIISRWLLSQNLGLFHNACESKMQNIFLVYLNQNNLKQPNNNQNNNL